MWVGLNIFYLCIKILYKNWIRNSKRAIQTFTLNWSWGIVTKLRNLEWVVSLLGKVIIKKRSAFLSECWPAMPDVISSIPSGGDLPCCVTFGESLHLTLPVCWYSPGTVHQVTGKKSIIKKKTTAHDLSVWCSILKA